MSDEVITCADCRIDFVFSDSEAQFYASKGLTKPRRCKPCRQKRKAASAPAVSSSSPAHAEPTRTQWVNGDESSRRRDKKRDRRRDGNDDQGF